MRLPFPSFYTLLWSILLYFRLFDYNFMPLVLFNTLSDKFLMKFLGKLLDEATVEFACLMYKNKGKMF